MSSSNYQSKPPARKIRVKGVNPEKDTQQGKQLYGNRNTKPKRAVGSAPFNTPAPGTWNYDSIDGDGTSTSKGRTKGTWRGRGGTSSTKPGRTRFGNRTYSDGTQRI